VTFLPTGGRDRDVTAHGTVSGCCGCLPFLHRAASIHVAVHRCADNAIPVLQELANPLESQLGLFHSAERCARVADDSCPHRHPGGGHGIAHRRTKWVSRAASHRRWASLTILIAAALDAGRIVLPELPPDGDLRATVFDSMFGDTVTVASQRCASNKRIRRVTADRLLQKAYWNSHVARRRAVSSSQCGSRHSEPQPPSGYSSLISTVKKDHQAHARAAEQNSTSTTTTTLGPSASSRPAGRAHPGTTHDRRRRRGDR
jgi:hypothetical protein